MIDMPNKGKVLLLDDDKFLIDMYSVKFAQKGFTIEGCLSANGALTILKGGFAPDVILFDITMPERDGFSFLEALHAEHLAPEASLIALTNQSDDAEKNRIMSLGTSRYIVKASMIPSEVVNIVEEELSKKASRS